jgi:DNA-binding MarR family transcriptional regulator
MASKTTSTSKRARAPHAYAGLDRVLHEKARLSILTALLARPEGVLFPELRALCDLTDGNLARHLQTLQDAELIELWKNQDGRRPRTLVRLSVAGRSAFLAYLAELERVVREAKSHATSEARRARRVLPPGWVPA